MRAVDVTKALMDPPTLWLGAMGFDPDERRQLASQVARHGDGIDWRFGPFAEADAWIINGARVRVVEGSHIRVAPGLPAERNMRLALADVNRPCAFAVPLPQDLLPLCQFDPTCPASVEALLLQLASWLQPLRLRIALGGQIMRRAPWMPKAVFHVHSGERLLAVVDVITGRVGFAPNLTPQLLESAAWAKRPSSANVIPPHFVSTSVPQLAWAHVRHSVLDWLPSRYAVSSIHYRGAPKVPLEWLSDSQLLLLQELQDASGRLNDLHERTGLSMQQIRSDLACLFVSGAITTSSARARQPLATSAQADGPMSSGYASSVLRGQDAPERIVRAGIAQRLDFTVPAPLLAGI